ncbi:DUF5719 family protein [Nocardioides sp.]|uniref:DUF5719 family protein n=1 Tax=Nocardioides sp. TaxID=35761 RepID=UPI002624D7E7|nr:DUF5719 family protein [Nocardioides sp.]
MNRSRHGGRRLDATVVLTAALPLVIAGALALTRPDAPQILTTAPSSAALTSAEVICPGALSAKASGAATLALGSATDAGTTGAGTLTRAPQVAQQPSGSRSAPTKVALTGQRVLTRSADTAPVVVGATGDVAPGLLGSVTTQTHLTAWDCTQPLGDQWFTGVGAGPTQASVIELVNPNQGPAIADIEVLSDEGLLSVPALRGVAVDSRRSVQLDLGALVPRTGVMALHVSVVRGQVGVAVRDRGERLTGGTTTEEWLAPQVAPAATSRLLGLQSGSGRHSLVIANPGEDQVTATVKLITADSTFAPDGLTTISVAPHTVVSTALDAVLRADKGGDAVGVEIDASAPVTSSLRSVVDGDLSFLVPGETVSEATTLLVPAGAKKLVLAGADALGVATVVGRGADGTQLISQRVSLTPKKASVLTLPGGVRSVEVTPERTGVSGAVLITGTGGAKGAAVLRLRTLQRSGAVPAVSFGP